MNALSYIVLTAIVAAAVITIVPFRRRVWLKWPMFTHTAVVSISLRDQLGNEINHFDHHLPGQVFVTSKDLQDVVDHLARKGILVHGSGTIWWAGGESSLKVRGGNVVVE
jgi:hypothetical protein